MGELHTRAVLMHLNALGFVVNQKKLIIPNPVSVISGFKPGLVNLPGNPVAAKRGKSMELCESVSSGENCLSDCV